MLKGSKTYFCMFGMMISTVNITLQSLFCQILMQNQSVELINKEAINSLLKSSLQKNQKYKNI